MCCRRNNVVLETYNIRTATYLPFISPRWILSRDTKLWTPIVAYYPLCILPVDTQTWKLPLVFFLYSYLLTLEYWLEKTRPGILTLEYSQGSRASRVKENKAAPDFLYGCVVLLFFPTPQSTQSRWGTTGSQAMLERIHMLYRVS